MITKEDWIGKKQQFLSIFSITISISSTRIEDNEEMTSMHEQVFEVHFECEINNELESEQNAEIHRALDSTRLRIPPFITADSRFIESLLQLLMNAIANPAD